VRVLHGAYRWVYGWQDALVIVLASLVEPRTRPISPAFMTAVSSLGLGTQLLVIALCAAAAQPSLALWLMAGPWNVLAVLILALRAAAPWTGR
jgi:hypothetical protein